VLKPLVKLFIWLILLAGSNLSFCQKSEWFGLRKTNTYQYLDPLEAQVSGSLTIFPNQASTYVYLPFTIGGTTSIYSSEKSVDNKWEIGGDLAVFSQFEWVKLNQKWQRNLLNADYKGSFFLVKQKNGSTFRFRLFHISSHLGDDYIIRNSIKHYYPNPVNYEQFDFTFYRNFGAYSNFYGAVGSVIRPKSIRKPLSFQLGYMFNKLPQKKHLGLTGGIDCKIFQQNNYTPNWKMAFGVGWFFKSRQQPVRLVFEYYNGHLPYSLYEYNKTQWLGLGLYFTLY